MLKCTYPIEKGYVRNPQDTYLLWLEALRMLPDGMAKVKDTGLVITEPPLNSWKNREELVELALEKLNAGAVSLQVQVQ
jgi:actin-related protein